MLRNFRCHPDRNDLSQSWRLLKDTGYTREAGTAFKDTQSMGGVQTGREGDKRRDRHLGERQEMKREKKKEQPGQEERREGVEDTCSLWETCSGYRNIYCLFVDFSSAGQTWTISTKVGRSIEAETGVPEGEHFLA